MPTCLCRYVFPGLALGAFLGESKIITDHMVMAAAEALPKMLTPEEKARRGVYPDLANIREISARVAQEVIKTAASDGIARGPCLRAIEKGDAALAAWVKTHMYFPEYKSVVFMPVGVNE